MMEINERDSKNTEKIKDVKYYRRQQTMWITITLVFATLFYGIGYAMAFDAKLEYNIKSIFYNAEPDITNAVEYDAGDGTFRLWQNCVSYQSKYKCEYAVLYVEGRKIKSDEYTGDFGISLDFWTKKYTFPRNTLFNAVIVTYDDNNEIIETILFKDIILTDGNMKEVENPEDARLFFTFDIMNMEDVIKFKNIENISIDFINYKGDFSLLSELKNLKQLVSVNGEVPLETLSQMTSLEYLYIRQSIYRDFDTEIFLNLTNLRKLHFMQFDILEVDFNDFRNLTQLESLSIYLKGEDVVKLDDYDILPNLSELRLKIRGGEYVDLSAVDNFENLEELMIDCYDIEECHIGSLGSLVNLKFLNILGDPVNGNLDFVLDMDNLKCFTLVNLISDDEPMDIAILNKLANLEMIRLANTESVKGKIQDLSELQNLEYIHFSRCDGITSDGNDFSDFENLETIWIDDCKNIKIELSDICTVEKLYNLQIESCPGVYGDIASFEDSVYLEYIDITSCENVYGDVSVFKKMKNIEDVTLYQYTNGDGELDNYYYP